jgi:hypothetical protein
VDRLDLGPFEEFADLRVRLARKRQEGPAQHPLGVEAAKAERRPIKTGGGSST